MICPVIGATGLHAPQAEHLNFHARAVKHHPRFVPIGLALMSPLVLLGHVHLTTRQEQCRLALPNVSPDSRLSHRMLRHLRAKPNPNTMRRMPLLSRRRLICGQDPLDERLNRVQRRRRPGSDLAIWRHCALKRLTHQTAMNVKLTGNSTYGAYAERKLTA